MELPNHEMIGPVVLLLLDGWGIAPAGEGNAIAQAKTPNFKDLVLRYPSTTLRADLTRAAGKKISVADNYSALGLGRLKSAPGSLGLFAALSGAGKRWLVITETEKFAFATYFFAGRRKIKPSEYLLVAPEMMDDYARQQELATLKIVEALLKKIKSGDYQFILADLASLDLAAHGGNFAAAVKAAETIDQSLKKIVKAVLENSGLFFITAPNGNAEELFDLKTETAKCGDTDNPVPFLAIGRQFEGKTFGWPEAPGSDLSLVAPGGSLPDVMPTILKVMGLEVPDGLDGRPLI